MVWLSEADSAGTETKPVEAIPRPVTVKPGEPDKPPAFQCA